MFENTYNSREVIEGYSDYTYAFDEVCNYWDLFFGDEKIGEFEYLDEDGRIWLSNCFINEIHQRKGLGSMMVGLAVEKYGEVYFCSCDKMTLHQLGNDYDSRYLTEEGVALFLSCVKKQIVKQEWYREPWKT